MPVDRDSLPAEVDVLIVGFGPTGATLAALLGCYGINTLAIDKETDILMMPRAIALDNEALRVLQMAGLNEQSFDRIPIPEVKMHSPVVGLFTRINFKGSLNGHPKLVTFYQPDLEKALRKKALSHDCVNFIGGHELVSFQDNGPSGVEVSVKDQDAKESTIRCRYLIGADGASSLVRSLIGQDFKGQTYAEDWLIVDAANRHGQSPDHVEFLCNPARPIPHMPAPGGRERWEFMLNPGESSKQMESPESIEKLLEPWSKNGKPKIERTAVYRFHARCCEQFSQGNVFLIGDAAHITPPFVGQGLVAGLRDAANLGWKLAWSVKGLAGQGVLSSYDTERRPHAKAMIDLARFAGGLIMTRNHLSAFVIHGLSRLARLIPPVRKHVEELHIKPPNRYSKGLFIKGSFISKAKAKLIRGGHFKQSWVRYQNQIKLSDDVIGNKLVLLGFSVDPRSLISDKTWSKWKQLNGEACEINTQGHDTDQVIEDLSNELLNNVPRGWFAIIRPDGFIMADGVGSKAEQAVLDCIRLISKT